MLEMILAGAILLYLTVNIADLVFVNTICLYVMTPNNCMTRTPANININKFASLLFSFPLRTASTHNSLTSLLCLT